MRLREALDEGEHGRVRREDVLPRGDELQLTVKKLLLR